MEMPKPTAAHARLETLAGTWEGTEKMYPSPYDPKGGTATGRTTSRVALGGFAVVGDYEQKRDGVTTFSGHCVWTYDPKEEMYVLTWFDSMGSPPEVFEGRFEGEVLRVAHGGPGMHCRLIYDYAKPGEMSGKMEMSQDGRKWDTIFEGNYKRK